MGLKGLTVRRFCTAIIVALVLACAAVLAFVFAPTGAASAESRPSRYERSENTYSYIFTIGDDSVEFDIGAKPVNNNAQEYGWFTYAEISGVHVYKYSSHEIGWAYAVSAKSSKDSMIKVILASDWTAQAGENGYSTFGKDPRGFKEGKIWLPSDTWLTFDLNGCVLDRAMSETKSYSGGVFFAENSYLEIDDGAPDKEHKDSGGKDIYTYTDSEGEALAINGGIITGVKTSDPYGGGSSRHNLGGAVYVFLTDNATVDMGLTINGGTIYGNTMSGRGGAILMDCTTGTMSINGGAVIGNEASGSYNYSPVYVNGRLSKQLTKVYMNGGMISYNKGESNAQSGIMVANAVFEMNGGEVSYNTMTTNDYYNGHGVVHISNSEFIMNGGSIHHNKAIVSNCSVRGLAIYNHQNNDRLNLRGGEIYANSAIEKGSRAYDRQGSIIYSSAAISIESGMKIYDNVVECESTDKTVGSCIMSFGGIKMSGGEIKNNHGGIHSYNNYDIEISGGVISGNTNARCGVIYSGYGSSLIMSGGSVIDNASTAVYLNNGDFKFSGGEISGNKSNGISAIYLRAGKFEISGAPVLKDNIDSSNKINNFGSKYNIAGKLTDGAYIQVTNAISVFTTDYAKYNNDSDDANSWNYPSDPTKYFYLSTNEGRVTVKDDEVVYAATEKGEFKAGYAEGNNIETAPVDGYGVKYIYEKNKRLAYSLFIKEAEQSLIVSKRNFDGTYENLSDAEIGEIADAGIYRFSSDAEDYFVAILPKDISEEPISIALDNVKYEYSGEAKEPQIVGDVEYDGKTFVKDVDYRLEYENNVNAGTAYAIVKFLGNYTGEHRLEFVIDITGGYYTVEWQYYDDVDKEWKVLSDTSEFEYIAGYYSNRTEKWRAKLTASGDGIAEEVMYAYADGVYDYRDNAISSANISGYKIEFERNGSIVPIFSDAGQYKLTFSGNGNFKITESPRSVVVKPIQLNAADVIAEVREVEMFYDGLAKTPAVNVIYGRLPLVFGIDYEVVYSDGKHEEQAVEGGTATAKVRFIGNYSGGTEVGFEIRKATNGWEKLPNIVRWTYGNFDRRGTVIIAKPKYLLNDAKVHVSIKNGNGEEIEWLTDIAVEKITDETYGECYAVSDEETVKAINALNVTRYVLQVWVDETSSYTELSAEEIMFNILKAENYWEESPSIESWITGEYEAEKNMPVSASKYGESVNVKITDETGEYVYYDSARNVNLLSSASAGLYIMTAEVKGTENYTGLTYSATFRVFAPESKTVIEQGMPWWGVLLIVLGVIAVLVAIMLILHIKGVLQLITGKMVIKMRAKADVDATIAAVRAGRMAAAATTAASSSGTTEKEEKKTEKKAQALEKKAKSPEEKAAELEAKAKAMRKKAEAMKAKAKVMVMTPEEKKAMKQEKKEREKEKNRVKSPEERAEALEKKAEQNEAQAEQLKAKAEVMKSRANEMRERAAKKKEKEQKQDEAEAPTKARPTSTVDNEEE